MGMESTVNLLFGCILHVDCGEIVFNEDMDFMVLDDSAEGREEDAEEVREKWQSFWDEAKKSGFKLFVGSDYGYNHTFAVYSAWTMQSEPIDVQDHIDEIYRSGGGSYENGLFLCFLLEKHGIKASKCSWWAVSDYG